MRVKQAIYLLCIMMVMVFQFSCQSNTKNEKIEDYEMVCEWADLILYLKKHTPQNSPTYASRAAGYIGLTMYESVVHSDNEYVSISAQLNGLDALPEPDPKKEYDWQIVFSAAQKSILNHIYMQTSDENKLKIDSLHRLVVSSRNLGRKGRNLVRDSETFGDLVANRIAEWAETDGGHRAYLNNFDKDFVHPEFPGSWKPPLFAQSFSHHPLHPNWGNNRTFVKDNGELEIPEFLEYSTDPNSAYYQQFMEVYDKDKTLTQEEKEIALWWGDDPDDTFTPPGHSFFIARKVVDAKNLDLVQAGQTFALVGISVADAFINCWKWKYHHFSERANTYITETFDDTWESFWPDPPFPAFPSGHAIQAATAAQALINLYGEEFEFTDDSHVGRERDEVRDTDFKARHFTKFWDFAEETADSRFFGGIHIPIDNEVGLREGKRIANNVSNLDWTK